MTRRGLSSARLVVFTTAGTVVGPWLWSEATNQICSIVGGPTIELLPHAVFHAEAAAVRHLE